MCSAIGLVSIGTIGFGMSHVSGRNRVPEPPAIKTAFIWDPLLAAPELWVQQAGGGLQRGFRMGTGGLQELGG
jgi:hypothetical protein